MHLRTRFNKVLPALDAIVLIVVHELQHRSALGFSQRWGHNGGQVVDSGTRHKPWKFRNCHKRKTVC